MEITEIRVKLADNHQERLLAFCTITFDRCFVVRDVKVIEGPKGPFVAMPSRKVTARCPRCREKNHLRGNYCNHCGEKLRPHRAADDGRGRPRLYVDIAHPINQKCRDRIERAAIEAFHEEVARSRQPGYVAPDLEEADDYVEPYLHGREPNNGGRGRDRNGDKEEGEAGA